MDSDGPSISKRDVKRKVSSLSSILNIYFVQKDKKDDGIEHVYLPLFLNPPRYREGRRFVGTGEEKEPEVDVDEFLRSFQITNQTIDTSKLGAIIDALPDTDGEEEEGDEDSSESSRGRGGRGGHPKRGGAGGHGGKKGDKKAEREAKPEGKSSAKAGGSAKRASQPAARSGKEKIIFDSNLSKEKEGAKADVARLLRDDTSLTTVAVKSCTGQLALNMLLVAHHWKRGSKPEALDIWLDLGYTSRTLVELVSSEEDYLETSPNTFIIPDLLEDVYDKCRPSLVALLAFLKSEPDLVQYELKEMGDRLAPLNWSLFSVHKYVEL